MIPTRLVLVQLTLACFVHGVSLAQTTAEPDTSTATNSAATDSTVAMTSDSLENVDTDSARIHMAMDDLYKAAKRSFSSSKGGRLRANGGVTVYASKLAVPGAESCTIEVDAERSHTFECHFPGYALEDARDKEEELAKVLFKRLQPEGYKRGRGSDFNYHQYRTHTLEFDSDNIDELGKHPTFTIGTVQEDDGSFTVVLTAIDPLWK